MVKSIKRNFFKRALLQAEEAYLQNNDELGDSIAKTLSQYEGNIRDSDVEYIHTHQQLTTSLKEHLWSMVMEIADYHDIGNVDFGQLPPLIEEMSESLEKEVLLLAGQEPTLGPHEELVPGEEDRQVLLEVSDQDE